MFRRLKRAWWRPPKNDTVLHGKLQLMLDASCVHTCAFNTPEQVRGWLVYRDLLEPPVVAALLRFAIAGWNATCRQHDPLNFRKAILDAAFDLRLALCPKDAAALSKALNSSGSKTT